jgi:ABC-2 family transporter protein
MTAPTPGTPGRAAPGPATPPPAAVPAIPAGPAAPPPAARPRRVPWTRLAWVTWRQHRTMLAGVAALLGGLSLYLLIYGLAVNSAYAKVVSCHPAGLAACHELANAFRRHYWGGGGSAMQSGGAQTVSSLLLVVPVMLGVFAGAPLIARELETGTFRFAWTQGCGRLRWALAKLVLLAVTLTAAAWAFSLLFSWYFHPFIADGQVSALLPLVFGLRGVAFAAWTLTAFTISAFAGAVIRRTIPAMAASLGIWTVLALVTALSLRPHYQAPITITAATPPGNSAWVVATGYTGPGGRPVSMGRVFSLIQHAPARVQNSLDPDAWLSQHHYLRWWAYQPPSRFWAFQYIEGGWLLALSVVLIAATVWLVRRRAA